MNHESSTNTGFRNGGGAVIKPWLSGGLVAALVAFLVSGTILIIMLSRFDDSKRQADEEEARSTKQRTELSALQVKVESLTLKSELVTLRKVHTDTRPSVV